MMALGIGDIWSFLGNAASIAAFIQQNRKGSTPSSRTITAWLSDPGSFLRRSFLAPDADIFLNQLSVYERGQLVRVARRLLIDADLLEALIKKIDECRIRHLDGIKVSQDSGERDSANRRARKCVCDILADIMDFNGGILPSPYLKKMWESYGCVA